MTRKPWHHAGSRHERGYGSEWQRIRKIIIARDNGLCQQCLRREDRPTPFTEVDHIKPKGEGGTDDADNLECVCTDCHSAKTNEEAARAQNRLREEGRSHVGADGWPVAPKRWGYSIPHGMRPAACKVFLVCGPPAAGKTTFVKENAARRDVVIDLDLIKVKIGGAPYDTDSGITARALSYRDMMIRGMADAKGGTAWLIVTAPTKAERAAWLDALGSNAELITIDATPEECERRIMADPSRAAVAQVTTHLARSWER